MTTLALICTTIAVIASYGAVFSFAYHIGKLNADHTKFMAGFNTAKALAEEAIPYRRPQPHK